jgi:hypothetical protein
MSRRGDEERAAAAREREKAEREHLLAVADTEAATKARGNDDGEHSATLHEHGAAVHERAAATHERAADVHEQAADLADEHEGHLAARREPEARPGT